MTIEDADAIGDRQDWEAADYTRIEDAAGRSVVACHDLSTIRPADARLLAAAPELFDMVRRLKAAVQLYQTHFPGDALGVVDDARALLARVQGEG